MINKWDINEDITREIEDFAETMDIPVLGRIPYTVSFIEALVNLIPAVLYDYELEKSFNDIIDNLMGII